MNTSNITIETKNLLLKGITLDYKDDIFREFTPEITTYMYPKPAERVEETAEFINASIKENSEGSNLQTMILDKNTKEFLGNAGLHHIDTRTPALGIWVKKSAHGHGYGKEAMVALKAWADKNLDYEYILYPVDRENHASKRIPEFLGGKVVKEYDKINMKGDTLHILEYWIYPPKK
jgi:RimJ/RimL family protein N-acetyltransferase